MELQQRHWVTIAVSGSLVIAIAIGGLAISFDNGYISGPEAHISLRVEGPHEAQVGTYSKWVFKATNIGPLPVHLYRGCGFEWGPDRILNSSGQALTFQAPEDSCHGYGGETIWPGQSWSHSIYWNGEIWGIDDEPDMEVIGTAEPGAYTAQSTFRAQLAKGDMPSKLLEAELTFVLMPES